MVSNVKQLIEKIDQKWLRKMPELKVGDNVKMKVRVQEGEKARLHPFEGTVIRLAGRGLQRTFTVRKVSFGEGVERTFPLNSPVIESLEITSRGVVNRARLYYLRGRVGKATRVKRDQTAEIAQTAA